MAYTNMCCRSGGSNLNAGTRTGNTTEPGTSADLTYASGTWANATRVFTVASGDPVADGVAVGDYAALDTGGSTAAYVARVSARTTTTITLVASGMGTNPANGTYTLRIGGAWAGPAGASGFPLTNTLTGSGLLNSSSDTVRINLKNDQTYAATSQWSMTTGPSFVQGYTSSYGDGGQATIDGGTAVGSYTILATAADNNFLDLIIQNNGSSSASAGVSIGTVSRNTFHNVVFNSLRASAVTLTSGRALFVNCEFYGCNQSNTAATGAVQMSGAGAIHLDRCMIHDNTGSNTIGVVNSSTGTIVCTDCVFDGNANYALNCSSTGHTYVFNCTFYNGGNNGIVSTGNGQYYVQNCLFVSNSGYGIVAGTAAQGRQIIARNCAYYNNFGQTSNVPSEQNVNAITLTGDPLVDAANGDFDLNNTADAGAACRGAGLGAFMQTAASYAGTLGYPDVGAAQHRDAGLPAQSCLGARSIGTY